MDETADNLQQVGRGQHLVPEIVRGVAVAVLGGIVARTALGRAPVKRQKARITPLQPGGHVGLVLAHRKVDQRPPLKGQQRLRLVGCRVFGQAGFLVLLNGVLHRLLEFALQLQGDNGNAVQKQHQVDTPRLGLGAGFLKMGLGGIGAVDQLRHHPQNIARVHRLGIRVQAMVGFELAELKSGGLIPQLVAQHPQGAKSAQALVRCLRVRLAELGGQLVDKRLLRVGRVELLVFLPAFWLGGFYIIEAV